MPFRQAQCHHKRPRSGERGGVANVPGVRGLSAFALVAGPVDGLEVVDGAGAAVSDSQDVINFDSAHVFGKLKAAEPAQAFLYLYE